MEYTVYYTDRNADEWRHIAMAKPYLHTEVAGYANW